MKRVLTNNKVMSMHSGIIGDASSISGDVSCLMGNLDKAGLSDSDRRKGVDIGLLIKDD